MTAKKLEVIGGIFLEIHDGTVYFNQVSRTLRDRTARDFVENFMKTNRILDKNEIEAPSVPHYDTISVWNLGERKLIKNPDYMGEIRGCSLLRIDNRFLAIRTKSQTRSPLHD